MTSRYNVMENSTFYNGSNTTAPEEPVFEYCRANYDDIPRTNEFLRNLPPGGYVLLSFLFAFTLATIGIYVEEVSFIMKTFKIPKRKKSTIWILAFCPVYSVCGFLAVLVPRSGTLIDLVANTFFGSCLYHFGGLMVNYMGGAHRVWEVVPTDRMVAMNTPPVCCCCRCLPPQKLEPKLFARITIQVMQVAIVRPILMFFAAILWTNQSYSAGSMSLGNGFIYITVANILSSMVAVYGLMLLRGAFREELEKDFAITGKIASIQLTLLSSAIPNLIIGILVSSDVIKCGPIFSSKARGEEIYHCMLVLLMLPFSLMARYFFRRPVDASQIAKAREPTAVITLQPSETTKVRL